MLAVDIYGRGHWLFSLSCVVRWEWILQETSTTSRLSDGRRRVVDEGEGMFNPNGGNFLRMDFVGSYRSFVESDLVCTVVEHNTIAEDERTMNRRKGPYRFLSASCRAWHGLDGLDHHSTIIQTSTRGVETRSQGVLFRNQCVVSLHTSNINIMTSGHARMWPLTICKDIEAAKREKHRRNPDQQKQQKQSTHHGRAQEAC